MTVKELSERFDCQIICMPDGDREISGGYAGDLLSWVISRAKSGDVWVTIMSNINIVAVASLTDEVNPLSGNHIVTNGSRIVHHGNGLPFKKRFPCCETEENAI